MPDVDGAAPLALKEKDPVRDAPMTRISSVPAEYMRLAEALYNSNATLAPQPLRS